MGRLRIGVMLESLRLPPRDAILKASEIGLEGIQFFATGGELSPQNLSRSGRKDLLKLLEDNRLEVSAVCSDFGRGFTDPRTVDELIAKTKPIIELSCEIGSGIVTSHIGVIPEDKHSKVWETLSEALTELGKYCDNLEASFACETGPEHPKLMREFIESLDTDGIAVNYDPANLVMNGFDPVEGVVILGSYIVHTHAKDGYRKDGKRGEVPLGEGQVNFAEYVDALDEIYYEGFYTIERETGTDPISDIVKAKKFLERF